MRNISFSITKEQFRNRTKTVTRRVGWWNVQPGEILCAVEKSQGLKKGEKVVNMGLIRVLAPTRVESIFRMIEDLEYGKQEVILEGFPNLTPHQFVGMFCTTHDRQLKKPPYNVMRIQFEYLDGEP